MPSGNNHHNWKDGSGSYRERAKKEYGEYCSNPTCPIKGAAISIPRELLDVDHIDNNRSNNDIQNLQVLCVWCHAIKTRLGRERII
jgi:hypothetical protein